MLQIPLSLQGKNKGKYVALVDDKDFEFLNQWRWHFNRKGYACRLEIQGKPIFMHRLIAQTPDNMETDHINGDKLDNRRANLRICTSVQNKMNRKSSGISGLKGVRKHFNKWGAYIGHNYKMIYLGLFDSKEKAALAYDLKAKELYGEFAKLNFYVEPQYNSQD